MVETTITELWKSCNVQNYLNNFNKSQSTNQKLGLRSGAPGKLPEVHGSEKIISTSINDGVKAWNLTSDNIKEFKSL